MGHSQGGGVAWAVAEALAEEAPGADAAPLVHLARGYRGAVAGSPTTTALKGSPVFSPPFVGAGIGSVFREFSPSDWLTPLGGARTALFRQLEGGISAAFQLFNLPEGLVRPDWNTTWYFDAYERLANAGRKPFRGPLLVLTGDEDPFVSYELTAATFRDTCEIFPGGDLELAVAIGIGHVPSLDATRQLWLGWIEDRLAGRPLPSKGCVKTNLESFLPIKHYLKSGNAFPQWAGSPEYSYETPLGV